MEEEEDMLPPFWLQTSDSLRRADRSRPSNIFLNSGVLLVILLVTAAVFIFVIVPSFVSFTSQIFKPHLVKKSWDSLNLVLVLFAIVCGFLGRNNNSNNNNNNTNPDGQDQNLISASSEEVPKSDPYGYADRTVVYPSMSRLRSSSSYPDLRQESWMSGEDRWRFYDDTHVSDGRFYGYGSDQMIHLRERRQEVEEEKEDLVTKNIHVVDKEVSYPPPPPPSEVVVNPKPKRVYQSLPQKKSEVRDLDQQQPPAPPSPPPSEVAAAPPPLPAKVLRRRAKRAYQTVELEEKSENPGSNDFEANSFQPPPPVPGRPPPPQTEEWSGKNVKRGGGGTKDFLISLRRRKKKQRQKSVENLDSFFKSAESSSVPLYPPPSPPPPPPPPPPPSVFYNLFSPRKSGKTKKVHSVPPPPPPPPPSLSSAARAPQTSTRVLVSQSQAVHVSTRKPPLPKKTIVDEVPNTGNQSPLIPIPPPPPPPPFKMQVWKFKRHGDFVRINSDNSSRSGSPDLDDVEDSSGPSSSNTPTAADGGDSAAALFCPSPDVDTKADSFIARFRAGLNLEKMNSMRVRSNLGREPSPSPEPGPS